MQSNGNNNNKHLMRYTSITKKTNRRDVGGRVEASVQEHLTFRHKSM